MGVPSCFCFALKYLLTTIVSIRRSVMSLAPIRRSPVLPIRTHKCSENTELARALVFNDCSFNDLFLHRIPPSRISKSVSTPDPPCQLHVFGHYSHSLGMDTSEVGVLEEADEEGFGCFLKSEHRAALKPAIQYPSASVSRNDAVYNRNCLSNQYPT